MDPFAIAVAADFLEEQGFPEEVVSLLRRQQALRLADRYDQRFFAFDLDGSRRETTHRGRQYIVMTAPPLPESQRSCHADDFPEMEQRTAIPETVLREVEHLLAPYGLAVSAAAQSRPLRPSPPPPRPVREVF